MILKPACPKCQRFFRPKLNGYFFLEGMPNGMAPGHTPSGTEAPEYWKPYKLWCGDLWECQGCGAEIIIGVVGGPIAEHYQSTFDQAVKAYPPEVQINDC